MSSEHESSKNGMSLGMLGEFEMSKTRLGSGSQKFYSVRFPDGFFIRGRVRLYLASKGPS